MADQPENIVGMRKKIKAQADHIRRLEQRIREIRETNIPLRHPDPHIHQYGEGVFVWFDEAGLPGGAECNLKAARDALTRYQESLNG